MKMHLKISRRLKIIVGISVFRTYIKIQINCIENCFWIDVDFDFFLVASVIFDHLMAHLVVIVDLNWGRTEIVLNKF